MALEGGERPIRYSKEKQPAIVLSAPGNTSPAPVLHPSGHVAADGIAFHNLKIHPHNINNNFKAEPHIDNHLGNVV